MDKLQKQIAIFFSIFILLSLLGIYLSYETIIVHVSQSLNLDSNSAICNLSESFDCGAVAASSWSTFLGQPLGFYGIAFYAVLILIILHSLLLKFFTKLEVVGLFFVSSLLASIGSIFLFIISKFVIGELCALCIGVYVVNFLLLAVSFIALKKFSNNHPFAALKLAGSDFCKRFSSLSMDKKIFDTLLLVLGIGLLTLFASITPKMIRLNMTADATDWPTEQVSAAIKVNLDDTPWGDYYYGDKTSNIQIVEFADFECPVCRIVGQNLKEWLKPYEGKYHFVYLNYPLDKACNPNMVRDMHTSACFLSEYSRCVGEQGQFWKAYDQINNLEKDFFEKSQPEQFSALVGNTSFDLDKEELRKCVDEKRYLEQVQSDINKGDALDVSGTPSLFINGQLVKNLNKQLVQNVMSKLINK